MKAFAIVTGIVLAAAATAAQTLPEIVRRQKTPIENQVHIERSPAIELGDLARGCDAIARVLVLSDEVVRLSKDQRTIETDHQVLVLDDIFAKQPLRSGEVIVVTKTGGALSIDGYEVTTIGTGFPPLQSGDEYILFLRQNGSRTNFVVASGAQGAFRNMGGIVEQVGVDGVWNYEKDEAKVRTPVVSFMSDLRHLASHLQ
jgi:hypothetical protein